MFRRFVLKTDTRWHVWNNVAFSHLFPALLSFIFGNTYLKVHIHRLSGFRIYTRSLRYSNIYSLHKTLKNDIQYLRSKNTYLKKLCIQDHSYCSMYVLTNPCNQVIKEVLASQRHLQLNHGSWSPLLCIHF